MSRKVESVISALMEFNKLARELSEKMAKVQDALDEASIVLAKIRLTQVDIEKQLKILEAKVDDLEKFKHKHFWQRKNEL